MLAMGSFLFLFPILILKATTSASLGSLRRKVI
jgi:hypothetical protein